MRGHPGPFGKRCAWRRHRVVLIVDVVLPEDIDLKAAQYHLDRCMALALEIAGARGDRIGCAIASAGAPLENRPL